MDKEATTNIGKEGEALQEQYTCFVSQRSAHASLIETSESINPPREEVETLYIRLWQHNLNQVL